ncbi:mitochondrial translation initiation factor 3 (IF3) [Andalucia godoyi]|uniref:Mitochondrial translation initiation factor 3 (IF3) n=1 Tax=Andalucia godoyi TaxID=505711 RepID=A0A8K0F156_ANDGO|nr:mitochondrial translation initiation factor 3 (IF3) [Andalucia godoyi]|eukprot:ANDGO_07146.mRNA.1 mitochondrial translation initiation factor 3 (IF3)
MCESQAAKKGMNSRFLRPLLHSFEYVSHASALCRSACLFAGATGHPSSCRFHSTTTARMSSYRGGGPKRNHEIAANTVTLVDVSGTSLGPHSLGFALQKAQQANYDLVEVDSAATPYPVCRLVDREKAKAVAQTKEEHKTARTHKTKLKEIRVATGCASHDLQIKLGRMKEFLGKGDQVRVSVSGKDPNEISALIEEIKEPWKIVKGIKMDDKKNDEGTKTRSILFSASSVYRQALERDKAS